MEERGVHLFPRQSMGWFTYDYWPMGRCELDQPRCCQSGWLDMPRSIISYVLWRPFFTRMFLKSPNYSYCIRRGVPDGQYTAAIQCTDGFWALYNRYWPSQPVPSPNTSSLEERKLKINGKEYTWSCYSNTRFKFLPGIEYWNWINLAGRRRKNAFLVCSCFWYIWNRSFWKKLLMGDGFGNETYWNLLVSSALPPDFTLIGIDYFWRCHMYEFCTKRFG